MFRRLGYFQTAFELNGDGVRFMATSGPDLVVWEGVHMAVERVKFLMTELEFSKGQVLMAIFTVCWSSDNFDWSSAFFLSEARCYNSWNQLY